MFEHSDLSFVNGFMTSDYGFSTLTVNLYFHSLRIDVVLSGFPNSESSEFFNKILDRSTAAFAESLFIFIRTWAVFTEQT